ncbi:MAG: cation transporter [Oscillospiraceae bacterium]|nr:cation transporter [Oscillospiraceae bacterium]
MTALKETVRANASAEALAAEEKRSKKIVRTSVIGILANVLLAAFKAAVGLTTNSIAIVLDAVNNLSDAASSIITIIGTKLAGRSPDKKHPFGYGRIEYMSAMIISVIVLYAGVTSLVESVKKILSPETPDYTTVSLVIVAVGVIVKILLGRYVKGVGKAVHSDSLVNSGEDATLDAVISASTLAAAIIFLIFKISVEAWLGGIISLVIIKSGIGMLVETISRLLGEKGDRELADEITKTVAGFPDVEGAYDLVLNNYGPDAYNGSVHVAVPDTLSADRLDKLIRSITMEVYAKHGVLLTAVGIYSVNTTDPEIAAVREKVREIVFSHEHVLQMHGFYLDREENALRFDIVVSFDAPDRTAVYKSVVADVGAAFPDKRLDVVLDSDFSEE